MNLKSREKGQIEVYKLEDMVKGWFIGAFNPTLYSTSDVEVAVKKYKKGDHEESHYHKIATEFTVIISGEVEMNGTRYSDGDIIKISPGTPANFRSLTDATTVVVKIPGAGNDKYATSAI